MQILKENGFVGLCKGGYERLGGWSVINTVIVILDGHLQSLIMKNGWSFVKVVCFVWTMLEFLVAPKDYYCFKSGSFNIDSISCSPTSSCVRRETMALFVILMYHLWNNIKLQKNCDYFNISNFSNALVNEN